jgi:ADP-ribosylglycohydrolase
MPGLRPRRPDAPLRALVARGASVEHPGDDADTTGAVYGQIAGAFYGVAGIPGEWLSRMALRERIEGFAERLREGAPGENG